MADTLTIKRTEALIVALEGLEDSIQENNDAIRDIRHDNTTGRKEVLLKLQEIISQHEKVLTVQRQIQAEQRNNLTRRLVEAWIVASVTEKLIWLFVLSTPILLTWVISKGVDPLDLFQMFLTLTQESP